ncbi:putative membrane protein [Povalibacter uvarum]|uniref:Putative membrane protein n=1 Tax=Povalibacter uvarum TaxID=732238 RepID=A0A841HHJ8_9GAMM|nr:PH domain-containing protein [Povalibacter uvarum]MBB6092631.1 putative membrane protein [Povalibacter uvarum]
MASESLTFEPQHRLHPLSWLFSLTNYIKNFIVPLAFLVFLGARDDEMWGLVAVVPLLIGALWKQWIYRYGFGPRGLVIRDGLFFRNVRQIDYARIENIDIERGLLHRLLGVAQASIATSTGGKAEASIRVLSLDAVQELREQVFSHRAEKAATGQPAPQAVAPTADEVLLRLPPIELVRFGLIDNRGMLVVAALVGFLAQGGAFELVMRNAASWLDAPLHDFAALGFAMQAAIGVFGLISALIAMRILSVAIAFVTLFDFTLSRHSDDFRVHHGLLTRLALTLRVRRIQSIHQTQTLLHRFFGRVSVRVDLAGDSGVSEEGKQQSQTRTRWLAPICTPDMAQTLIATALPDVDFTASPNWQPLAPRARGRIFRKSVYFGVFFAALTALTLHLVPEAPFRPGMGWIPAVLAVLLPIAWWRAHVFVTNTRWALTDDAVMFRYGWLTRRLIVAPRNRLQSVHFAESPFDRRHRMASVSIDTAGGGAMRDNIHIPFLPEQIARALMVRLYHSEIDRGRVPQALPPA